MGIDTKHPDYDRMAPKWKRMRDVIAGQDAIHAAGVEYLPMLTEQTAKEYMAYKLRAGWLGATSRAIDALHGLMLRKPPVVTASGMDEIVEDATMSGQSVEMLTAMAGREILDVGRCGIMVDFPVIGEAQMTVMQAIQSGQRPFATLYKTESIINWRSERVANRHMLVEVRLFEQIAERKGEFEEVALEQIRRLMLDEAGVYVQQIYRRGDKGDWELVQQIVPQMNGAPLRYIPFVIVGPEQCSAHMSQPPLIDMADVNLSHYRSTADLEHGAHLTGLPMLFLAGVELEDGQKVYVGSQTAVVSRDPSADGKWIEFTGQGLEALEKRCEKKEQQMAALGARMLAPEKRAAEAQGTVEMRVSHETSMLADVAQVLGQAMTQVLQWLRDWSGASGDASVQVNTDYVVTTLSAQEVTALVAAWQQGAISKQTLFWNLQQGEVVEDGVDFETEEARIGDAPPMTSGDPMELDASAAQAPADPPAGVSFPDLAPLVEAINNREMPAAPSAPVDFSPLIAAISPLIEAFSAMQAPVVNVTTAPITVEAPQISLPPINVTIEKSGGIKFVEDAEGKLVGAEMVQ
jgi:hypothetical protein